MFFNFKDIRYKPKGRNIEDVIYRLDFYKRNSILITKVYPYILLVLFLSVIINIIQFDNKKKGKSFYKNETGQSIRIYGLSKPYLTKETVSSWVEKTLSEAISMDFYEYKKSLSKSKKNFNPGAYTKLISTLKSNGVLSSLINEKLSITMIKTKDSAVLNQGMINGKKIWKIESYFILSYESSGGITEGQNIISTTLVERTSTANNPRSVLIKQVSIKATSKGK